MESIHGNLSRSSMLPLPSRFQAHLDKLHKQQVKIQQLERDKHEQKERIRELEDQAQHLNQMQKDQDETIAQLRRELADHDHEDPKAEETIDMLTRQVEKLKVKIARAEEAQRDAEADYILRHFVGDDDGARTSPSTLEEPHSELTRVALAEQQSSRRVGELEAELEILGDTAEALSREVQDSKEAKQQLEAELQEMKSSNRELERELQQLKRGEDAKAVDVVEDEQWESMASVCQNLVTSLRAQVKTLAHDKKELERAIECSQRSANNRLETLEQDRQNVEVENGRLRTELARLRQDPNAVTLQFPKLEEENVDEALAEKEMIPVTQARVHEQELAIRVQEVEQKLAASLDTAAYNQQLVTEKNELLRQLEEERRHSRELVYSAATFKEATETALKQLKEVEIELRAINRSRDSSDEQHETVASLARLVITDLKRQQDESVDAAVASMQVLHLTSSLEEHLLRLRALRGAQDSCLSAMSSSDPEAGKHTNVAEDYTLIQINEVFLS
ncbi:hypothetical protein GN244_ATG15721 [Phytophthora infestans]|uniref:Uncharacterized protein n=1 Tax=Phytophthora infestans TaxID=4787 RepID=A0A833SEU8_PHYIN|nr:hypothetical protein GN244_ATG15721 [Phytophthora infestans]KAF4149540.1 hypothetical protein GN958_ATG01257 [Phytophthora infestans]